MPDVQITKTSPADILKSLSPEVYERAYKRGHSLSVELETMDPSSDHPDSKMDAFERLLKEAGIRTKSLVEYGVSADEISAFDKSPQAKTLLPELLARYWRRAVTGKPYNTRALYQSNDSALNTLSNPYFDDLTARADRQIAPQIPIAQVVAATTLIDRDTYRSYYLTDNAAEQRMVRVGAGAEIPGAKLVAGERTIQLHKYGRKLELTYEQMRHMKIDIVALHIARMAVQTEIDKLAAIIDIAVNGDGNANTAATSYNLTALDGAAVSGTLTTKGWLAFKMKFANPYQIDTALSQEDIALQMQLLNVGSANVPLVSINALSNFGGFRPINPQLRDNVGLGWTSDAPASKVVGIDSRFAIQQLIEVGTTLKEVARIITNQTEVMTMTEVQGFNVLDQNATKILVVNA
jgi:hypothetical protein